MQQTTSEDLDVVLRAVKDKVEQLLVASTTPISSIPDRQGVYLIFDKTGSIIYVGKAKNLKRRVSADHCGGDADMSTSTFRRSVHKMYGIAAGKPVREWVKANCSFAFVEISDPDLSSAVEASTIRLLRLQGSKLLNS